MGLLDFIIKPVSSGTVMVKIMRMKFLIFLIICILTVGINISYAGEDQYDRIISYFDNTLDSLKKFDLDKMEMLLWYGVQLNPQRMEAYHRLTCLAILNGKCQEATYNKKYMDFILYKAYKVRNLEINKKFIQSVPGRGFYKEAESWAKRNGIKD